MKTKAKKTPKKSKTEAAVRGHANGKAHGVKAEPAGTAERIERKRYKTKLPCPIEPALVVLKADELAVVVRKMEEHRMAKRNVLAKFRDEKAQLEENLSELATAVEQHTVTRDVECVDYLERGHIVTVRQDTLEQVGEPKAASAEDLQEKIFTKIEAARAAAEREPTQRDSDALSGIMGAPDRPDLEAAFDAEQADA